MYALVPIMSIFALFTLLASCSVWLIPIQSFTSPSTVIALLSSDSHSSNIDIPAKISKNAAAPANVAFRFAVETKGTRE